MSFASVAGSRKGNRFSLQPQGPDTGSDQEPLLSSPKIHEKNSHFKKRMKTVLTIVILTGLIGLSFVGFLCAFLLPSSTRLTESQILSSFSIIGLVASFFCMAPIFMLIISTCWDRKLCGVYGSAVAVILGCLLASGVVAGVLYSVLRVTICLQDNNCDKVCKQLSKYPVENEECMNVQKDLECCCTSDSNNYANSTVTLLKKMSYCDLCLWGFIGCTNARFNID